MHLKSKLFLASIIFVLFASILRAENEFPMDAGITYGKLDNGFTYYIRKNEKPKDKVYILGTAGNNPFVKTSKKNEESIMVQKGVNEKIFYISDKEEGAVLKSLKWKSFGFLIAGAVLSLFGLTVILISFGLF